MHRLNTVKDIFSSVVWGYPIAFVMAAIATFSANLLAVGVSLYSMQVYDRVIPSQGISTLLVLTIGVLIALVIEFLLKIAKSKMIDIAAKQMDIKLSDAIFTRLLKIRLDQLPQSVGALSSQLRSYEVIRKFMTTSALYLIVDVPFALVFLLGIYFIGGLTLAIMPTVFFVLAVSIGIFYRWRIDRHAKTANKASNEKLGRLVEAVENAETIKANGVADRITMQWRSINSQSIYSDAEINRYSEYAQYWNAFVQQLSYIFLVATGAYLASSSTEITMGALIAVSILAGRVLAPVAMLPSLIVQHAHTKQALASLEKVFSLELDHHNVSKPLTPNKLFGNYQLSNVVFSYPERKEVLQMDHLQIHQGERVGILGSIGSGKSTLLKMLAGLYPAQRGMITLDGLEIQQISRMTLTRDIAFVAQGIALLSGTLRYNLTFDKDIDENFLREVCLATGLQDVINAHPKGLDMPIFEGGAGLSGGQKQLVAITRAILRQPTIWLLDEPTANIDEQVEARLIQALNQYIKPEHTLVLVSHKSLPLKILVDRIIYMSPKAILHDGSKSEVFAEISRQLALKSQKDINEGSQ